MAKKIKWVKRKQYDPYDVCKYFSFTWLSAPSHGVFHQASHIYTCRETFANALKRCMAPRTIVDFSKSVSLRKLRICVIIAGRDYCGDAEYVEENLNKMREAQRVVNVFEKQMGWAPTKITHVKDGVATKNRQMHFIVEGPSKWMRAIPYLSLYLLLIRGAFRNPEAFRNFNDIYGVRNIFTSKIPGDGKFVSTSRKIWPILFKNYEHLTKFRSVKDAMYQGNGFEGINYLSNMTKGSSCTDRAFKKVWFEVKDEATKK
jgi:hypothetical protein